MFVYKISEILKSLNSMKSDGYEYVSLDIIPADDDCPEDTLSIECIESANDSECDTIDSVILPSDYICHL